MISGDVFGCQVDNGWAGLCGAQLMSPFGSAAASYPRCCVQFCKQLASCRTSFANQDKPDLNRMKPFMGGKSTCGF